MQPSSRIACVVGLVLFVLSVWDAQNVEAFPLVVAFLSATYVATLCGVLAKRNAVPCFLVVVLFALAYFPDLVSGLTRGIQIAPFTASPDSVLMALGALLTLLSVIVAVTLRMETSSTLRGAIHTLVHIVDGGRTGARLEVLFALTALAAVIAFGTGTWTNYSSVATTRIGGFRLELLYHPLLFAGVSVAGRRMGRTLVAPTLRWGSLMRWGIVWSSFLVLLFLLQSRRFMIFALALSAIDPVLHIIQTPNARRGIGMRLAVNATIGGLLLGGMLIGSSWWRDFGIRGVGSWGEISGTAEQVTEARSVNTGALAQSLSDRLRYLWIDAISIQYQPNFQQTSDLTDVLLSTVVTAMPALLLPEKARTQLLTCESAFSQLNVSYDLSCTATSEAIIYGGLIGFIVVVVFVAIATGFANVAYAHASDTGLILACCMLMQVTAIESSAFPIVFGMRTILILGGLLGIGTWCSQLVSPSRRSLSPANS